MILTATIKKIAFFLPMLLFIGAFATAQNEEEKLVFSKIESLNKAMLAIDEKMLDKLTADKLTYGHSSGRVEDKKEFIRKITSRENIYSEITTDIVIVINSGDVSICRFQSDVIVGDGNRQSNLKLFVVMVWQKQSGEWRLLARQSTNRPEQKQN